MIDGPSSDRRGRDERPKGAGPVAWRPIDGVLLLDKPSGISSAAAVARARRALRAEKAGHTGTLDPMASGLLPLCFGEATKFASDLLDADKSYAATIRLGIDTDSGDAEGSVIRTRDVVVDRDAIERVLARFKGPIEQVPPMFSALKRDGKPLYHYARQGITVERAARSVTIRRLEATAFEGTSLSIVVDCSKGTYVRTLAEDIGEMLGCGGHLVALRRLAVGPLSITDAVALDAFESGDEAMRPMRLLPIDTLIGSLPRIDLDERLASRFGEGQRLAWTDESYRGRVRVYRAADEGDRSGAALLLGTGLVGYDERLAPVRLIARTR